MGFDLEMDAQGLLAGASPAFTAIFLSIVVVNMVTLSLSKRLQYEPSPSTSSG